MAIEAGPRARLDPSVFRLPVERIKDGWYTDAYFNFTRQLLQESGRHPHVTMQVFQKQASVLGGIDEAIAVLKLCSDDWGALEVHALYEGDAIAPWETVLTIEGDYSLFAHLETVYLGCLARRTLIMRNVREVVEAAQGKPILFFPARHDHWLVQTGDGWAAHVAGAIGVSTDAQASWWGGLGVGTVPHGLIAAFGGDTVAASVAFADHFAGEMNVTVLVDFENDSVRTAIEVAEALESPDRAHDDHPQGEQREHGLLHDDSPRTVPTRSRSALIVAGASRPATAAATANGPRPITRPSAVRRVPSPTLRNFRVSRPSMPCQVPISESVR